MARSARLAVLGIPHHETQRGKTQVQQKKKSGDLFQ
jgi:hypothetical protein